MSRRPSRFLSFAVVAAILATGIGWAAGKLLPHRTQASTSLPNGSCGSGNPGDDVPALSFQQRGELLFGIYCASCHGSEGRGDGPSAISLHPRPRDFAVRPWRFPFTKESIRTMILDGIPGTAMASNRMALTTADADAITDYVFRLASSQPDVNIELTANEKLLRDAGFIDLKETAVPPLQIEDSAGKEVALSDFKGRLVLIHFWGMNCTHCLKEMPRLKALEENLKDRSFLVLHICTDTEDVKEAQSLADRTVSGLQVFTEASGLGLSRFDVQALPSVWLVSADGKAVGRLQGARDWSSPELRHLIEHWLPSK